MIDIRAGRLAGELAQLHTVASQASWEPGAKTIHISEFVRALTISIILAKENPRLDMPTPGIDPDGFIWLTYLDGETRGMALELRQGGKYKWTQSAVGDKRTFESDSLNDVAEAMRTVFPQAACLA